MIVGQNALLNQFVPTFFIKDIVDGQTLRYDSTRKAFVNVTGGGGSGGATRLGELDDVSPSVDNPLSLQNGQVLTYNTLTDLWENQYIGGSAGLLGQVLTSNGPGFTPTWQSVSGTGSVTSVSVVTANGVSGLVANPTTTPAITLTLGAITPTSVASIGTITGSNLSGINTGNQVISLSGDATNSNTSTGGTLTLTTVNATVGSFGSSTQVPVFTVDAKGRITSVTNTTISTSSGTVTSVSSSGGSTGMSLTTTSPTTTPSITLSGTLGIANGGTGQTTATAAINALLPSQAGQGGKYLSTNGSTISWIAGDGLGTVTSVTANGTQGVTTLVTNGTTTPNIAIGLGAITPTSVAAVGTVSGSNLSGTNTGDQTITLTGEVTGSGTSSFATALSTTGVVANTYGSATQVPVFAVDSKGRITGVTNTTIAAGSGTVTSVGISGANGIGVASSPITTSGTIALSLGAITPSSVAAVGTVTGSNLSGTHTGSSSGTNTGDQTITLTGAVTGTGTGSFATTYAGNLPVARLNSGTGASGTTFWRGDGTWATPAGAGTVTSVSGSGGTTGLTLSGGPITGAGTLTIGGTLDADNGGTGQSVYTVGDILYANTTTTLAKLVVGSNGQVLTLAAGVPTWAAGGGGSSAPEVVVFHYSSGGSGNFTPVDAIFSQTAGVAAAVTDGANCVATFTFTGKTYPPKSIILYGQNFAANTFSIVTGSGSYGAAVPNIRIVGGGTSASPDLANGIFSATNVVTLQLRMSDTGSSSTIGNRAWLVVQFGF